MTKLFFLLSGEHETLPVSELKAIIEAEGYSYKVLEELDQVLRLDTSLSCVGGVKRRAAFTRICGLELFRCRAESSLIAKSTRSTDIRGSLRERQSFAVRVRRVKRHAPKIDRMLLERKIGQYILSRTTKTKVDLKNPDKTFIGILTDKKFVFGIKLAEILPKPFVERRPRRKPFFHPSAMPPKLARCMVNLAKPKTGELVLDPFCGTGGMLIEAALIGCRILGVDIKKRMIVGSLQNMTYSEVEPEGILVADARNIPVRKVHCVVTDPPYGRSATTLRRTTKQIVEEVLIAAHELLDKNRLICIAAPKTLGITHLGIALKYKYVESHAVYVHRSLTREIAVFGKV